MRMLSLTTIALAGLSAATIAVAKNETKQQEADKVICKRQGDADTGSHFSMPKKVCRTKAEWKELEDSADSALQGIRDHGNLSGRPAGTVGGGPH
jgi:hypothetical protein